MRKLNLFLVLALLLGIAGVAYTRQTVQADCDDGTTGNDTITCTGTDTGFAGTYTDAGDDTITIEADMVINAVPPDSGVDTGTGNDDVVNNGTITGTTGINNPGGYDVIVNNGTIDATNVGINTDGMADIYNTGTINGDFIGVYGSASDDYIVNEGTITGGTGIDGAAGSDVIINDGTIVSTGTTFFDGGIATGLDSGVDIIINNGTIDSANYGINLFGAADVYNTGTIQGDIYAIYGSAADDIVINDGTLIGNSGTAVNLEAGNDVFDTLVGAYIFGDIDGGSGNNSLVFTYQFEAEDFFIPAEYEAIRATIEAIDLTTCPCTVGLVINGLYFEYTFTSFNFVTPFLNFIKVTFTPYEEMNCQNGVKCFALKDKAFRNGNVQIYAAEGDQGVAVATVNFRLLGTSGYTFTNEDNGWTVTITYNGTDGDALTYSIVLSKGGDVRNAGTVVLAFQYGDSNAATHALAWR